MSDSRDNGTPPAHTDVLIVGAGPVGLSLACALRGLGIDHVVIDRAASTAVHSRAAAVHARTLELLDTIGAADKLAAAGRPGRSFTVRDGEQKILSTPFNELDSPYPFVLAVPQQVTEKVLDERYIELGGTVHRQHTLLDLRTQHPGMSALVTDDRSGEVRAIQARYVVGCDGIHSTVRARMGVPFVGHERSHNFALIEFEMEWTGPEGEITFFFSPAGLLAVSHLNDNLYRIVALVEDDAPDADLAEVQRLLDTRGPSAAGASVKRLVMASTWRVRHRIADTFGEGPVFLAGDAAHVHSPVGAQGMNTGIQDSFNLAWKLAAVLNGSASSELLHTYNGERRPVVQGVLAFTEQLHDISTMSDLDSIALRNSVLAAVGEIPSVSAWLAQRLAQLAISYETSPQEHKPGVGQRMPPRPGMAKGIGWSLLLPQEADAVAVKETASTCGIPITVATVDDLPHAVMVRPDGYIALVAQAADAEKLPGRLVEWLDQTRP